MARVVVAEDQAHIRLVLQEWLEQHGHEVLAAPDGVVALQALQAIPADVLVTDLNMPQMDGVELSRRAFGACPTLRRILVVSSRCDVDELVAGLNDARIAVFRKPFSPSGLLRAVEAASDEPAPPRCQA